MYKVANCMSPEIINKIFKKRNNPYYNLRHTLQFSVNPIHSVYNGTGSASHLGPNVLEEIPSEIRIRNYLNVLSSRSRNENQLTTLVEFVKSS